MRSIAIIGALAILTAPLAAQGKFRTGGDINPSQGTNRLPTSVIGQVLGQEQQQQGQDSRRKSDRIPPGQMPPAGMCRIWIDGVPPGRQPAPTDCQTAVATKPANARVIFGGDGTSFPGKANGKFDKNKGKDKKVKHQDRDRDDDDLDHDDDDKQKGKFKGKAKGRNRD
ncbi:MAG: hypothetical protein ABIR92_01535 [Gemmatimonadaceae bacterium]